MTSIREILRPALAISSIDQNIKRYWSSPVSRLTYYIKIQVTATQFLIWICPKLGTFV